MKTWEIWFIYLKIWQSCKNVKNRQNLSDGAIFSADTVYRLIILRYNTCTVLSSAGADHPGQLNFINVQYNSAPYNHSMARYCTVLSSAGAGGFLCVTDLSS
jgi:hypothetical protein